MWLEHTIPGGPRAHHPHPPPDPSRTTAPIPGSGPPVLVRKAHWLAEGYSRGWKIEVVTSEKENGEWLCFDKRQLADYAWRIAQALEQCYGSPYGIRTGNHGFFDRLFRVGNHGIEVGNSPLAVEVKIGSFDKLAELWCW